MREFFILREQNNTRAIDIAWVALLLALLRQSIRSIARLPNASIVGISPNEYDDLAKRWSEGLKGALYLADAWQRPQIRCIQAMVRTAVITRYWKEPNSLMYTAMHWSRPRHRHVRRRRRRKHHVEVVCFTIRESAWSGQARPGREPNASG